ncbi:MAG: hypothetical protein QM758_12380 [Armatimonas sp.]
MPDSLASPPLRWTILVYRIPPHPTRLRLTIWRRLQKMGALYLQDGVTLLPDRDDLTENMTYVAQAIQDIGGECDLFAASPLLPNENETLIQRFRKQADRSVSELAERLNELESHLEDKLGAEALISLEETLRRERTALLRLKAIAHFGSEELETLENRLDALRERLLTHSEGE